MTLPSTPLSDPIPRLSLNACLYSLTEYCFRRLHPLSARAPTVRPKSQAHHSTFIDGFIAAVEHNPGARQTSHLYVTLFPGRFRPFSQSMAIPRRSAVHPSGSPMGSGYADASELEKYQLISNIGKGSFGVISKVRRVDDGRVSCRLIQFIYLHPKCSLHMSLCPSVYLCPPRRQSRARSRCIH
jgi:NIMA (never in mitosis gene a)-related kinase